MASETCSRKASEHNIHRPSVSFTWASAPTKLDRSTRMSTVVDDHRDVSGAPPCPTSGPGREDEISGEYGVLFDGSPVGSAPPGPPVLRSERYTVPAGRAAGHRLERGTVRA